MSENTYEYECMRAELLGIEKPNYNEFLKNKKEVQKSEVEEEEIDTEIIKVRLCIITYMLCVHNSTFVRII